MLFRSPQMQMQMPIQTPQIQTQQNQQTQQAINNSSNVRGGYYGARQQKVQQENVNY